MIEQSYQHNIPKKLGVVLQIGLHQTAEYSYLARSDWRGYMSGIPEIKRIPEIVYRNISNWRYFGVDYSPISIAHVSNEFRNQTNVEFVQVFLSKNKFGFRKEYDGMGYHSMPNLRPPLGCIVPETTLDNLTQHLGINKLDCLAIDVEGYEHEILESFSFITNPKFIAVEIHLGKHFEKQVGVSNLEVINLLKDKEYIEYYRQPTNYGHTLECQFVHNSAYTSIIE